MQDFKYLHRRPDKVIVRGSKYGFRSTVKGVLVHEGFTISVTVTNGSFSGDSEIVESSGTATVTIIPSEGYSLPDSITVTGASYEYDSSTGVVSLSNASGNVTIVAVCESSVVVDPILDNNSWEVIRAVCEAGDAANYWAIGDTKNVTGGDSSTRPVAIVDMSGLYNKHVAFQYRSLDNAGYVWDAGGVNDYSECDLIAKLNAGGDIYVAMVDAGLHAQLTETTVKVAKGGNDSTLVNVTQKLFLPAEKEITGTHYYSVQAEFDALSTFAFYSGAGDTNANRILKGASDDTVHGWWERSPYSGIASYACLVNSRGGCSYGGVTDSYRVAPCFAF